MGARLPVVGDGRDPAASGDAQPGPAGQQILPRQQLRFVRPEAQRGRGTGTELVSVGQQHEGMGRVHLVSDQ